MNVTQANGGAWELGQLYRLFLAAVAGHYALLSGAGFNGMHGAAQLEHELRPLALTFLQRANELISAYPARTNDGNATALADAFLVREQPLRALYEQAVAHNLAQARGWMLQPPARGQAFTRSMGAMGGLLQNELARPQLTLADAVGRQWPAHTLVYTSTRDAFYQTELSAEITTLRAQGYNTGKVVYPEAHRYNGRHVALDELELMSELHDEIFHVNASASLEAPHVLSA